MEFNAAYNQMSKYEKRFLYIDNMVPVINTDAFFSDGTAEYRFPPEPMPYDQVRIRFRTWKENVEKVFLVTSDEKVLMEKEENNDQHFDFYTATVSLTDQKLTYYFEIVSGKITCYYNAKGTFTNVLEEYHFSIWPGFKTPDWAKGAIFYQIYVDRFYNGDKSNDVVNDEYQYIGEHVNRVDDWGKYPATMGVREFYGGDLEGVRQKLDYLENLGVEVLYLNPIFVSPSNHKYDIQDYDYIDPHFGVIVKDEGEPLAPGDNDNSHASKYICRVTDMENLKASNDFFARFMEEVHARGMKVVLDGVFNHCGSFNKWLDREKLYENQEGYSKGAYVDKDSPYHTFFKFYEDQWPYNHTYDGWWGHDTLPKLNYEDSPKLEEYILNIAKKWVSPPYNVDGWRLDVAADLGHTGEYNHRFWQKFRKAVKEANPNAIILAEHYGDPSSWLQGDQWDTVMNYDAFMEPITWFLTGVDKHSDEFRGDLYGNADAFWGSMSHHMTRFNTQSLQVAMNELSNHDHSRFLTRTNHWVGRTEHLGPRAAEENINKGIMREAVVIQMTWPGAPTIYYGDEAGVCGWTDPDNRRTYPWGREDKEMIRLHRELIRIHKDYQALKTGSLMFLHGEYNLIAYGRFDDQENFIIIINNNEKDMEISLKAWRVGLTADHMLVSMIQTNRNGFTLEAMPYYVEKGTLRIKVPPLSGTVLREMPEQLRNHEVI
ncbi:MAG: glycoside hydrolase family 13 protein [Clostridiales bacterium]|nr:glycoside hydrolase family 13 protein [Clostridiales bacterium]